MEFDINRVYTALNADEVKPGSRVIVADDLAALREKVEKDACQYPFDEVNLDEVNPDSNPYRFAIAGISYMLCYLVSEPKSNALSWTKLKIGDVIQNVSLGKIRQVTGIDSFDEDCHIFAGSWLSDIDLKNWEKVKKENDR